MPEFGICIYSMTFSAEVYNQIKNEIAILRLRKQIDIINEIYSLDPVTIVKTDNVIDRISEF